MQTIAELRPKTKVVIIILLVAGLALGWAYLYRTGLLAGGNYAQGLKFLENYERAMAADNIGGRTPEETLQLFIEALKKEDLELASQYFILDETGRRDPKIIAALRQVKKEGMLAEMIEKLEKLQPGEGLLEGHFAFILYNKDGVVESQVDVVFNKYSNVWKIENL